MLTKQRLESKRSRETRKTVTKTTTRKRRYVIGTDGIKIATVVGIVREI